MKTLKTTLGLITAAVLPLALFAAPSSAATGVDDQATVSGSLYQRSASDSSVTVNPPFQAGQEIKLFANFSGGVRDVTFYKEVGGVVSTIGTDEANSYGNAYMNYTVVEGEQKIFAEDVNDKETETDTITGTPPPPPQTGTLDPPSSDGKTWTAHFTPGGQAGRAVELQVQRIATWETNEVNPTNSSETDKKLWQGPWRTIATGQQNAAGDVTFNISSPYPYRVKHKYRAVSGPAKTCDPPSANTCQTFGIANPAPYDTGLSKVYFNTLEGHAVDTRSRYFEGEFSMTADSKGLGCSAKGTPGDQTKKLNHSAMKGRGNYSWSFKRKSYTLKLGDGEDLCGMGGGEKSKKWALVSQDYDKSFLRNKLAQYVGSKFSNLAWTPKSRPVDFYLNGKFMGNYMLIERVAIDQQRININELNGDDPAENQQPGISGGYVLEWDFRKGADYNAYLGSDSGYVGVKEPENDFDREGDNTGEGISSNQKAYIRNYLNSADSALRRNSCQSGDYENFIDKASAVDYYIAMEYMKPVDGNMWASVYMYKPQNEKLFFGPLWDFDLAAGSASRAGNVASSSSFYLRNNLGVSAQQSSNTWFNCLNKRASFRSAVKARWNAVKDSIQAGSFIDEQKNIIAASAARSFQSSPSSHGYRISQYQVIKSSWSADVSYLRGWANARKSWLSNNF